MPFVMCVKKSEFDKVPAERQQFHVLHLNSRVTPTELAQLCGKFTRGKDGTGLKQPVRANEGDFLVRAVDGKKVTAWAPGPFAETFHIL